MRLSARQIFLQLCQHLSVHFVRIIYLNMSEVTDAIIYHIHLLLVCLFSKSQSSKKYSINSLLILIKHKCITRSQNLAITVSKLHSSENFPCGQIKNGYHHRRNFATNTAGAKSTIGVSVTYQSN